MQINTRFLVMVLAASVSLCAKTNPGDRLKGDQVSENVWNPDLGNGRYKNPVIYADYSDPDVVRVGEDYYMTASSFNCVPGLPILHSRDLVNWRLLGHALPQLYPSDSFSRPQHGNGVWAPAIRYHNEEFYIYYGDPDYGIFMTKASDPLGEWTRPQLVKAGKGWIDPCPLWDDDGKAYLVHAWAGSRSGLKSVLIVHEMNPEGTELLDDGVMIFDGHQDNRTVEGPKFYKKDGTYYIFAPAGGVTTGWQLVLRSDKILGPYASKTVLHQGNTDVNGPHQGAWVDTPDGSEDWFIHFQDKGPYGRIVHLQPVVWEDGWPLIGIDQNNDGIGEPVAEFVKPETGWEGSFCSPPRSDEFNEPRLGLQWQWHANPGQCFGWPSGRLGYLRLNARILPENYRNLWDVSNLLLQKFPAPEFIATTKIEFFPTCYGDRFGLIVMGHDYAFLALVYTEEGVQLQQVRCIDASSVGAEEITDRRVVTGNSFYLRVSVEMDAVCSFSYSTDGVNYQSVGKTFRAKPGKWIGAKTGLFFTSEQVTNDSGYANIDWFRVTGKNE